MSEKRETNDMKNEIIAFIRKTLTENSDEQPTSVAHSTTPVMQRNVSASNSSSNAQLAAESKLREPEKEVTLCDLMSGLK